MADDDQNPSHDHALDLEHGMLKSIEEMRKNEEGFDCVIICCSTEKQAEFWGERLMETRGEGAKRGAKVYAVSEDWAKDGAGNGLGTLYAFKKASVKAKVAKDEDLLEILRKGGTVGLYHTAGKGTRLAPLPGAENNNKPGVKLPACVNVNGEMKNLTILEAVVKQTNRYAEERPGRISVFWGDQIFIPSAGHNKSGTHHADILAVMQPMPDEKEWTEKGFSNYGLIAVNDENEATQVEKVSHKTASELLKSFGKVNKVGPSLGSFSLGHEMLSLMLNEFEEELEKKQAKFDSDPHFWMPLTMNKDNYSKIMQTKDETKEQAEAHHERMQKFKSDLLTQFPEKKLFGSIDVGQGSYWWDYGLLRLYRKNNMLVTGDDAEAEALRKYLGIESRDLKLASFGASIDDETNKSVIIASSAKSGSVKRSVVSNVNCGDIEIDNCLLVNVTAKKIKASNAIIYNVVDDSEDGLILPDGQVYTNVFMPTPNNKRKLTMTSTVSQDGGKVFKVKMATNPYSFNDVYGLNGDTDVREAYAMGDAAHAAVKKML
jgi:ADP-glucose pyrophosphorylase